MILCASPGEPCFTLLKDASLVENSIVLNFSFKSLILSIYFEGFNSKSLDRGKIVFLPKYNNQIYPAEFSHFLFKIGFMNFFLAILAAQKHYNGSCFD